MSSAAASAAPAASSAAAAVASSSAVNKLQRASKSGSRNPNIFHVVFVRHAESTNNVLAEQITRESGINPYGPNSTSAVMAQYDQRRSCDPALSELGQKQAALLPKHPHLHDIKLDVLAAEHRVRVITSPMQRAIMTSIPMLQHYSLPRATLVADVCEKGGSYTCERTAEGVSFNKANPGHSRAELDKLWGATHDASGINEAGWWQTECPGEESHEAFDARMARAREFIENEIAHYAQSEDAPDYLIIGQSDVAAKRSNTAASHLEFEVQPGSDSETVRKTRQVRVRGTNIKPVKVEAHELAVHHK